MEMNAKKRTLDHLVPGATCALAVLVIVGIVGIVTSMAGQHQVWLGPLPWVLIFLGLLLSLLIGTVLGRSMVWHGASWLVLGLSSCLAAGLLGSTLFIALWQEDRSRIVQLKDKCGELASLMASLERQSKSNQKLRAQDLQQVASLTEEIAELKKTKTVFTSQEDVERIEAEAIETKKESKPANEPPDTQVAQNTSGASENQSSTKPTPQPGGFEESEDQGQGENNNSNNGAEATPPTDETPSEASDGGKSAFMMAAAGLLAAAGLSMPIIMAILAVLGQLFSMGVKDVQTLRPIIESVKVIHAKKGALTSSELRSLLEKSKDPKLAADALRLICQQRQVLKPEAYRLLDKGLSSLPNEIEREAGTAHSAHSDSKANEDKKKGVVPEGSIQGGRVPPKNAKKTRTK